MKRRHFDQNASFHLNRIGVKTRQIPNQSSICDLFNQVLNCNFDFKKVKSIVSLPNSIIGPEVGRLSNLVLDSVNFSPSIYASFPIWSLVLDFFN
jgi:hypothetical protein